MFLRYCLEHLDVMKLLNNAYN